MNTYPHTHNGPQPVPMKHLNDVRLSYKASTSAGPSTQGSLRTGLITDAPLKIRAAAKFGFVTLLMLLAQMALVGTTVLSASAAAGGSSLQPGQTLRDGQSLVNGQYTMAMQTDGNFVLYAGTRALWQSGTAGRGGAWVSMQGDGNLVVYNSASRPLWWSGTAGHGGSRLEVQTDGNAVIYNSANQWLWQTNTAGQGSPPPSGFDYTRRMVAIRWEQSHAGSSGYNNLCETAVENAYGTSGQFGSARIDYNTQLRAGGIHTDRNAPAGALVFFNGDSAAGHVGIAVGDGQNYWTTDGTIHVAPYSEGLGYLGWSYAPSNW